MRNGTASGFQIVFLSFAVVLLAAPLSIWISAMLIDSPQAAAVVERTFHVVLGALVLVAFPPLRRLTLAYLSKPVPVERRLETALVAISKVPLGVAYVGLFALWYWITEGPASLAGHLTPMAAGEQERKAFSTEGVLIFVVFGAILAPVVEEVLFRGLLFDAWARQWGAFTATIFTSALFALYHPHFTAAFTSAIVFVCVVRRTGTLWGSIAVHSFFNLMMWYPFAGQFVFPDPSAYAGDLSAWRLNIACLVVAAIALPAYVLLAILRPYEPRPEIR